MVKCQYILENKNYKKRTPYYTITNKLCRLATNSNVIEKPSFHKNGHTNEAKKKSNIIIFFSKLMTYLNKLTPTTNVKRRDQYVSTR